MRVSVLVRTLLLLIFIFTARHAVQAQYVIGYSQVTFDDATNSVFGYSTSELDYYSSFNYQAYVEGYLYDEGGNLLDSGSDSSYFLANVITHAAALPAALYTVYSDHYLIAYYYTEVIVKEPDGCWPCDGCNTDCYYYYDNWYWWDPYGFAFMDAGYFGDWWEFLAYEVPGNLEEEYIYQGTTGDFLITPPDSCKSYPDASEDSYSTSYSSEALNCPVRPSISGQHEVWCFDGVTNVKNYATQITLTSHPGNSNNLWLITDGAGKVLFTNGGVIAWGSTADIYSVLPSDSVGDVSVIVYVGGIKSAPFTITVSAPNSLKFLFRTNSALGQGYETFVSYLIKQKLGNDVNMPSSVPATERFPNPSTNWWPNNWQYGCPGGGTAFAAVLSDDIRVGASGQSPSQCNPGTCLTILIDSIDQQWKIGTAATGLAVQDKFPSGCPFDVTPGRLVQTDKLERSTDGADHGSKVSPVQ